MSGFLLAGIVLLGSVGTPAVGGKATYYAYHEGQAAAAHDLKVMVGPDWRGMRVRVTGPNGNSIIVRLTDSESSRRAGALIDLDTRDFAKLAPLSTGRIDVMVEVLSPSVAIQSIPLPQTDTALTLYDILQIVR